MCDNVAYIAALVGYLVGLIRDGFSPFEKSASILALSLSILMILSVAIYYRRFNRDGKMITIKYGFREGDSWLDKTMQALEVFGKRDLFALIFLILAMLGVLHLALVYICLVAAGVLLFSIHAHKLAAREFAR